MPTFRISWLSSASSSSPFPDPKLHQVAIPCLGRWVKMFLGFPTCNYSLLLELHRTAILKIVSLPRWCWFPAQPSCRVQACHAVVVVLWESSLYLRLAITVGLFYKQEGCWLLHLGCLAFGLDANPVFLPHARDSWSGGHVLHLFPQVAPLLHTLQLSYPFLCNFWFFSSLGNTVFLVFPIFLINFVN